MAEKNAPDDKNARSRSSSSEKEVAASDDESKSANAGAKARTMQNVAEKTNSARLQGIAATYRRSLSPQHHRASANNAKSLRQRQNRSPNSPVQVRSGNGNGNGSSNHGGGSGNSASPAVRLVSPMHTRNHVQQQQHQQQQRSLPHPEGAVGGVVDDNEPDQQQIGGDGDRGAVNPVPMDQIVADFNALDLELAPNNDAPYNWQATKKTLKERMKFMFNNELMADILFIVGKGASQRRIPAHKFILSTGSAVFDAMFNGAMASTSQQEEIPDVEPAAFLALLRFLYSDEVIIGPETVMTTLYTAKKYAVPALESACVDFLKQNLSSDNAFMLLTQARLFDEPQLAALCLETIDKNTTEALAAEGFTDIDLNTLCVVLERDTLGIRECKLFNAVARWAVAECSRRNLENNNENKRQCLGRALELIRFPLMTVEEFAQGAAQSGILSDREVVQLFLYFTVNPKPQVSTMVYLLILLLGNHSCKCETDVNLLKTSC